MGEEGIQDADRSHPGRRLTVAQAADVLGVSVDAVRARIKRKTIEHLREGGRVYVILGADLGAASTDQYAFVAPDPRDELVEELRDRVRYLEEESRRKDHLLAAALERIPALEASSEATGAAEMAAEEAVRGDATLGQQEPAQRRSWWREFFGMQEKR